MNNTTCFVELSKIVFKQKSFSVVRRGEKMYYSNKSMEFRDSWEVLEMVCHSAWLIQGRSVKMSGMSGLE